MRSQYPIDTEPTPASAGGRRASGIVTIDAVADGGPAASEPRNDSPVRRLTPYSGIQFLDIEFDAGILPMISAWFTEETVETSGSPRRVLLPIEPDKASGGSVFHPVTFKPLGPGDILSVSGVEAIEPFLDGWIPVPFLRYLGRHPSGQPRFDHGPSNWARLFIERPEGGLRGTDRIKAVLAFDTRLDQDSRADGAAYAAPNVDDALFASTFLLVDDAAELSWFLSQPWVDGWLKERMAASADHVPPAKPGDAAAGGQPRFALGHLARYLGLLKVLDKATDLPRVRFLDSVSRSLPVPEVGLDLVLELGPTETTAILVPRDVALSPLNIREHARGLRLRDLDRPTTIHDGPIPSVVEFDNQTFGSSVLSRRGGRSNAFSWPSLVRIGREAERLSRRANAVDGMTGESDLHGRLASTDSTSTLWRFSTPDLPTSKLGPMVTGEVMRHVGEDGEPLQRAELLLTARPGLASTGPGTTGSPGAGLPAVRPRFSHSSLTSFFFAELLLHAISEIASAEPSSPFGRDNSDRTELRRIERIVVTSPLAMTADDRHMLTERVHNAIDLVWRVRHAEASSPTSGPGDMPQVAICIGADVGLQLIHVFDEVHRKYGGSFTEFVKFAGRTREYFDHRHVGVRIASLEVGMRTLGLTVIDYATNPEGTVEAELVSADRTNEGADRIVEALAEGVVVPAIERALGEAGIADPRRFLIRLADNAVDGDTGKPRLTTGAFLARRFEASVIRPAAAALFRYYAGQPARTGLGVSRATLAALAVSGGGRVDPVAKEFDALAVAAGARGFEVSAIAVDCSRRQFEQRLESELWPFVDAVCEAVRMLDCDLMVTGGDLAGLPDLLDRLILNAPTVPGRISVVAGRHGTPADTTTSNHVPDAVLGAYMSSRNFMAAGGLQIATSKIADHLTIDTVPGSTALAREQGARTMVETYPSSRLEVRS